MIPVIMVNKFSAYAHQSGLVSALDWEGDSSWVPVAIRGVRTLMARRYLQAL